MAVRGVVSIDGEGQRRGREPNAGRAKPPRGGRIGRLAPRSPRPTPRATLVVVTAEAERLLEAAMKLPDAERAELAVILADSIGDGSSDEEIEAAWVAEAKRRLQDIRAGKSKTIPWEDTDRKLRAMLDGARKRQASAG